MTAPAYNTVTWFQVSTDDPQAARDFYGDLFGWTFATGNADGYDLISYPGADAPSGGIAKVPGPEQNSATFLVLVEDVAAVCARTEKLGGKVLVQPTTTPAGLTFAHLLDPSGNDFGIFTPPSSS